MKKGKYYEELVELIETSLNPDAEVRRDVRLPIINSESGATTQCDLVITQGKHPREIITIVEVQNRKEKTKPNAFRGWLGKLERVGAQRLICVSRKGFSKPIQEEARNMKGTVLLIQLDEVPKEKIPLDFIDTRAMYHEFTLKKFDSPEYSIYGIDLDVYGIELDELHEHLKNTNITDKIYTLDKKTNISLQQLCSYVVPEDEKVKGYGTTTFNSYSQKKELFVDYRNVYLRLDLDIKFDWSVNEYEIPISYLKYDQDEYDVLVWLVKGNLSLNNRNLSFEMPFTKDEKGYHINNIRVQSTNDINFSLYGITNEKDSYSQRKHRLY